MMETPVRDFCDACGNILVYKSIALFLLPNGRGLRFCNYSCLAIWHNNVAPGLINHAGEMNPSLDLLREQFRTLAQLWHDDTDHLSSPSRIVMHPAYQRIIAKGERVIPLILEDLRKHGGEWYWALRTITGDSPVPPEAAGRRQLVKQAWLNWGWQRGYIN